jgi:hypothetical protein
MNDRPYSWQEKPSLSPLLEPVRRRSDRLVAVESAGSRSISIYRLRPTGLHVPGRGRLGYTFPSPFCVSLTPTTKVRESGFDLRFCADIKGRFG